MTQKLDWYDAGDMLYRNSRHKLGCRTLIVNDGTVAHDAFLPDGMSVREALEDYAAGYEGADKVGVTWELWEGGKLRERGRETLATGDAASGPSHGV